MDDNFNESKNSYEDFFDSYFKDDDFQDFISSDKSSRKHNTNSRNRNSNTRNQNSNTRNYNRNTRNQNRNTRHYNRNDRNRKNRKGLKWEIKKLLNRKSTWLFMFIVVVLIIIIA